MVPPEGRELPQSLFVTDPYAYFEGSHSSIEIPTIEQADLCGDQVQRRGTRLMVLMAAITETTEAVECHGPGQGVPRLALVQLSRDLSSQCRILAPAKHKQRALDAPDLTQRSRQRVLLAKSGKLLQDQRRRDDLVAHGVDHWANVVPVGSDEVFVEPMLEQRRQLPVSRSGLLIQPYQSCD